MRISDWSSDVCSSDLEPRRRDDPARGARGIARDARGLQQRVETRPAVGDARGDGAGAQDALERHRRPRRRARQADRRDRTAAEKSRGVPAPWNSTGQGLFALRSEEHTSELQSLMRNSYAVFCLKKKKYNKYNMRTAASVTK